MTLNSDVFGNHLGRGFDNGGREFSQTPVPIRRRTTPPLRSSGVLVPSGPSRCPPSATTMVFSPAAPGSGRILGPVAETAMERKPWRSSIVHCYGGMQSRRFPRIASSCSTAASCAILFMRVWCGIASRAPGAFNLDAYGVAGAALLAGHETRKGRRRLPQRARRSCAAQSPNFPAMPPIGARFAAPIAGQQR